MHPKDRLNVTIIGTEPIESRIIKKSPMAAYIMNSRFAKGKRHSINTRQNVPVTKFDGNLTTTYGTPKEGIFQNSRITFIKPQINNVTIITNPPNPTKARATISRCMMEKRRSKARPVSIIEDPSYNLGTINMPYKSNIHHVKMNNNRELLNKSAEVGRTIDNRTQQVKYLVQGQTGKTPAFKPETMKLVF